MLQLRQEHLAALEDAASRPVRTRVAAALIRFFPEFSRRMTPAAINRLCLQAWRMAAKHELPETGDVFVVAVALLVYGEDLEGAPYIAAVLNDEGISPALKVRDIAIFMSANQERAGAGASHETNREQDRDGLRCPRVPQAKESDKFGDG